MYSSLPHKLLSMVSVPVVTTAKITSKDNYRPIALASVVRFWRKLYCQESRIMYPLTVINLGSKQNMEPTFVMYLRKLLRVEELICICLFLFDRANHNALFNKCGMPHYIISTCGLVYLPNWCVCTGEMFSKAGKILSPPLFNLYMVATEQL